MTALLQSSKQGFAWKRYLCLAVLYMSSVSLAILLLPNRLNLLFLLLLVIGIIGSVIHFSQCLFSLGGGVILALSIFALFDWANCRLMSLIYTCSIVCLVSYYRFMIQEQYITCEDFLISLRCIVYIFGIVAAIQVICFITSLPIFNMIGPSEYFYFEDSTMRFSSLAYEPAHYSKIVALCLFAHTMIYKNRYGGLLIDILKKNYVFYGFGILQMLCMQSSTALVLCGLFFLCWMSKRNFILLLLLLFAVFKMTLFWFSDNIYIARILSIWEVLFSLDMSSVIATDGSAAVRIAPYFIYLSGIGVSDWHFWFGHGFDASVTYFTNVVNSYREYIPPGIGIGGFFVSMPYNYGILFMILLLWWIKQCCFQPVKIFNILCYLLICYDMGFNTYIVCFATLIFVGINYFTSVEQTKVLRTEEISK